MTLLTGTDDTGPGRAELDVSRSFAPIGLVEIQAHADLQSRIDRKYVVDLATADDFVTSMPEQIARLEIDDLTAFAYRSTYFDTPDLDCFHDSAHRRRRRFKVRIRTYVDSGLAMAEVKVKSGRGRTIKHRLEIGTEDTVHLHDPVRNWARELVHRPDAIDELSAVLTSRYRRRTFVDTSDWSRCTIDDRIHFDDFADGRADIGDHVIIETKSTGSVGSLDRWLWRNGIRPVKISKYCSAAAAMHPELPSNRWSRTIHQVFRIHPPAA
ncbi:MAG: polyphosphate polymerase domain-containing protein [Ilumatobacter sp.]